MTASLIGVAITSLGIRWLILSLRFPRKRAIDAFVIIYAAYTGPLLIELAIWPDDSIRFLAILADAGIPVDLSSAAYAAGSLFAGLLLLAGPRPRPFERRLGGIEVPRPSAEWIFVSTVALSVGALLAAAQRSGLSAVILGGRSDRGAYSTALFIFYASLFCGTITARMACQDSPNPKPYIRVSRLLGTTLVVVSLLNGDRRFILFLLIAAWAYSRTPTVREARKHSASVNRRNLRSVAIGLVALAGLLTFSDYRWAIPSLLSGELTVDQAVLITRDAQSENEWYRPSSHEFAGPGMSLLSSEAFREFGLDNEWPVPGSTYASGLISAVPVFPPANLGQQYSEFVNERSGLGGGYGFHPAAEASLNFGSALAIAGGLILGFLFLGVDKLRSSNRLEPFGVVSLLLVIDLSRINFSMREVGYIWVLQALVLGRSLLDGLQRKPNTIRKSEDSTWALGPG